jgi:hypothetical protein
MRLGRPWRRSRAFFCAGWAAGWSGATIGRFGNGCGSLFYLLVNRCAESGRINLGGTTFQRCRYSMVNGSMLLPRLSPGVISRRYRPALSPDNGARSWSSRPNSVMGYGFRGQGQTKSKTPP